MPVLERVSGLRMNVDFSVGYSPERINSGDKQHTVTKIRKVTSGSNPAAASVIDGLCRSVIEAGTHLAPSIRVAEAAKVIENSQRDINIAFVNELARIFNRMGIDTLDVLEAAATKWNFLPFRPGLVGGHCIGVDPSRCWVNWMPSSGEGTMPLSLRWGTGSSREWIRGRGSLMAGWCMM